MPWESYGNTIIRFSGGRLDVDLRRPLGSAEREGLKRLGLAGSFAVVTACNPLGRVLEPGPNRRLAAQLGAIVRDRWPGACPADGISPDGAHVEPGWALPGLLEPARTVAARFFQRALFWYDGEHFHILPVLAPGPSVALPGRGPAGGMTRA